VAEQPVAVLAADLPLIAIAALELLKIHGVMP
jgi:hypothetical protein